MKIRKRIGALLAAGMLFSGAGAEEAIPDVPVEDWPELNAAGYLDSGEYVYENPERGLWRYCSETLKIEIFRKTETEPEKKIWYEAEVWSRKETFGFVTAVPGDHIKKMDWPTKVCSRNGAVLAVNGDYAANRWGNMANAKYQYKIGIIIRDGEILNEKTRPSGNTSFPNLDNLALYPDGNMEVYDSRELTAQEYLDRGATDVLAFGPWLVRDGEMNPNLKKFDYYHNRAPRTAIGMVRPGHYFVMMAEGRHKESRGVEVGFLGEKMLEHGCSLAFNLDGGETSCILFMGKQICTVGKSENSKGYARRGAEFLAIGTSERVEGYVPPDGGE